MIFSFNRDVTKIEEGISQKLALFFQWFSLFLTGMIIAFSTGWKLCLVILGLSPAIVIAGGIFAKVRLYGSNCSEVTYKL